MACFKMQLDHFLKYCAVTHPEKTFFCELEVPIFQSLLLCEIMFLRFLQINCLKIKARQRPANGLNFGSELVF